MTYDQSVALQNFNKRCGVYDKAIVNGQYWVYIGERREPLQFTMEQGFRLLGPAPIRDTV